MHLQRSRPYTKLLVRTATLMRRCNECSCNTYDTRKKTLHRGIRLTEHLSESITRQDTSLFIDERQLPETASID